MDKEHLEFICAKFKTGMYDGVDIMQARIAIQELLKLREKVEKQKPMPFSEIQLIATYAPEGTTDDDIVDIVRRVEHYHGIEFV
jgi:hypothetical protein